MLGWFRRRSTHGKWTKDAWKDAYTSVDATFRIHSHGRVAEIVYQDAKGKYRVCAEPIFQHGINYVLSEPEDFESGTPAAKERAQMILDTINDAFLACDGKRVELPTPGEGTALLERLSSMDWRDPGRFL